MSKPSWNLTFFFFLAVTPGTLTAAPRYYESSLQLAFSYLGEAYPAQPSDFRVKLLTSVSTETSQIGDSVTARVITPAELRGDIIEGSVKYLKKGGKIKGQAILMFSFEKLQHEGKNLPVKATVQAVLSNDETLEVAVEGILSRGNRTLENTAFVTTQTALIGGLVGGLKGFGIGAGIGSGATLGLTQLVSKAPAIYVARGTELILSVD